MKQDFSEKIIWSDKKRFLGMPITFTNYHIKNGKLFFVKGFINTQENEVFLYRILDVKLKITAFDKLFKVGTLNLSSCDKIHCGLMIEKIKNPNEVKDLIVKMIVEERKHIKDTGEEIYGVDDGAKIDDNLFG